MKAITYTEYGPPDVLQLREVDTPTPGDKAVLIRVHAASVNYADWGLLNGKPLLIRLMTGGPIRPKHKVLGADVAGRIESVGKDVSQFHPGDEVFGCRDFGTLAEYVTASEDELVLKPVGVTFEEAAAVPLAATTALQAIRYKGKLQSGHKVLINGASGGVGTFAVQIAKSFGAEVTAVCSTRQLDVARSIGADHVIDYTQEDFTQHRQYYDLIVAANGYHSISDYKRALSPEGVYVCIGGSLAQIFQAMLLGPLMSITGSKRLGSAMAKTNKEDLVFLKELLEAGKVVPVIDRRYPLSETAEALRYLGEGHSKGKVVITVDQSNNT